MPASPDGVPRIQAQEAGPIFLIAVKALYEYHAAVTDRVLQSAAALDLL